MPSITRFLESETDTLALGAELAHRLRGGMVVFLSGELGAGKTTLARGLLRALGYQGRVKSPTYALVELYNVSRLNFYHFDFYRINHPAEIADAGLLEHFRTAGVCLVEWPEHAAGLLPAPDLHIALAFSGQGRLAEINAETETGRQCLEGLHR